MKLFLEFLIVAANLFLCRTVVRRQFNQSFPHFFRYAYYQAFAATFSLVSYLSMRQTAYAVTYYLLILFGDILAVCVAGELAGKLLGPNGALPQWVSDRFLLVLGLGIAAAMTMAILLLTSSYGKHWGRAAVSIEHCMTGIVWVTFSAILLFWRTLKVFRRQTISAWICAGFVLYFTVSVFTVFARGHQALSGMAESAGLAGMVSYLATLLLWTRVARLPVPEFKGSSQECKECVFEEIDKVRKAAARAAIISQ